MATISLPFAASATKRAPAAELSGGYPCGPLDRDLDNWLEWWVTGQIANVMTDAGLTVDDTDLLRLATAIRRIARKVTRVTFSTPGSGTWTVPAGVNTIVTKAWGAGGGGGYNSNGGAPSGGGSGAYVERAWAVTPGQVVSFNIGAGGAGGSGIPAQSGQPGGNTTVTVGGITTIAGGGGGGNNGSTSGGIANSPAGGAPSGGDVNLAGMPGPFGTIANNGTVVAIVGGDGAGAPSGGQIVPGGQGLATAGNTPGGGGSSTGNSSNAGAGGARGEIWIEY